MWIIQKRPCSLFSVLAPIGDYRRVLTMHRAFEVTIELNTLLLFHEEVVTMTYETKKTVRTVYSNTDIVSIKIWLFLKKGPFNSTFTNTKSSVFSLFRYTIFF